MKKLTICLTLLLALLWGGSSASAQTAITSTTLSAAITSGQAAPTSTTISVTSATGMAANGVLWIEGSLYRILSVSGTTITVINQYAPASHNNSAVVYVVPTAAQIGFDPTGSCIRSTAGAFPAFSPFTLMFNTSNGHIAMCRNTTGGASARSWVIGAFAAAQPTSNPPTGP